MHRLRLAAATAVLALLAIAPAGANGGGNGNAVFTLTNAAGGNAVMMFDRHGDGTLTPVGSVATGGLGTGLGLGSQGALVKSGVRLLAVNAGSNTISFLTTNGGVRLRDTAPSGGVGPISITVHRDIAYVVNQGDMTTPANISGFRVHQGELTPLPGSSRPLSTAAPGPAQIEFAKDGTLLVVTEKGTNRIVTYQVDGSGYAGAPNAQASAGQTPFGFAQDRRGRLIVSEAYGGAPDASVLSSYDVAPNGTISVISPNVATTETAACWVVTTENGKYAYTTNTGSSSISGYAIGRDGTLTLLDADGKTGMTTPGSAPIDAALSNGSRFLYALEAGTNMISAFRVRNDGGLDSLGSVGGLPAGSAGLVAE